MAMALSPPLPRLAPSLTAARPAVDRPGLAFTAARAPLPGPAASLAGLVAGAGLARTWRRLHKAGRKVGARNGRSTSEDKAVAHELRTFSTGVWPLDLALGGGLPVGEVVDVFGPADGGKTTLALSCIRAAQQSGRRKRCALVDVDGAVDCKHLADVGLCLEPAQLLVCRPRDAEEALAMVRDLASSRLFDLIVLDSLASLVPQAELASSTGDPGSDLKRLLSRFFRKLHPVAREGGTTVLVTNQIRANFSSFGPAEVPFGGNALQFWASVRLEIKTAGLLGAEDKPWGARIRVEILKNAGIKLPRGSRSAEFDLTFGRGVRWEAGVVEAALNCGLLKEQEVDGGPALLRLGARQLTREALLKHLESHPAACAQLAAEATEVAAGEM